MSQGFTMNSVFVAGNLTRDPEVRYSQNGKPVTTIGLAVNNRKKVGDTWQDDPCFLDVVVFGTQAEQAGESLNKGSHVVIEGHLQYRTWEAQDGSKRSKLEVVADLVKPSGRLGAAPASHGAVANDDDIPF